MDHRQGYLLLALFALGNYYFVSRPSGQDAVRSLLRADGNPGVKGAEEQSFRKRQAATIHCLNKLHASTGERILEMIEEGAPPLVNVHYTNNNTLYLLFNTNMLNEGTYADLWKSKWFCDSKEDVANVWEKDPHHHSLIMECPADTSTKVFNSLGMEFELQAFLECEKLESLLPPKLSSRDKLVMCTSVQGEQDLALVPQWIEYHRLFGFQQFWIYVNDNWIETKKGELPKYFDHPEVQQYASLIPYDFVHVKSFFYQQAIQNDCITLGRRENITWMALIDVDEFFQMRSGNSFVDFLEANYGDKPGVGSLQVSNWFFGSEASTDEKSASERIRHPLILDYTYSARNANPRGQRAKHIVKPENVIHFSVHRLVKGGSVEKVNPKSVMRFAHYKHPSTGIWETAAKKSERVLDTTLKEEFGCRLQERLSFLLGPSTGGRSRFKSACG